jgi:FixJ family two-component response regulator
MSNAAIITRKRNTRQQMENVLMQIEHRICQGQTDKEIMEELGIRERTFYYNKEKIYQLSAEVQSKKNTAEVLAFEMQILKDRLSRMYRHLDERITATENMKARDLAKIVPVACDIAKAIFQLEKEGLRALSGINKLTSKAAQQISQN